jgi:hypothetical protein
VKPFDPAFAIPGTVIRDVDVSTLHAEADHLHNLPQLLADYHPDRLRYYWDIERPSFIKQVPES